MPVRKPQEGTKSVQEHTGDAPRRPEEGPKSAQEFSQSIPKVPQDRWASKPLSI